MSSILDALKKSEAERQRGVPPTLSTPILHRGQPARPKRPAWLLPAVAAVALVLAWAGGLFSGADSEDAVAPAAETVATTPTEIPAAASPKPEPATTPPAPETAAPAAASPADAASGQPARSVGFGPYRPRPTTTAPGEAAAAPAESRPEAPVAAAPAEATDAPAQAPVAAPATLVATTQPAPATPAGPEPAGDDVPTLHQLPYAVRREIPQLALTLHMFSTDPERRFAIINGVRVTDGQPIEGGIDVKEIRPNGVLVRYKDTDFLLPARG